MNKKKKIFLITGISLLVLIAIVGGTYAWYVWTTSDSDTTKIVAGVGAATVTFDGGSDINANLRPVSDKGKKGTVEYYYSDRKMESEDRKSVV